MNTPSCSDTRLTSWVKQCTYTHCNKTKIHTINNMRFTIKCLSKRLPRLDKVPELCQERKDRLVQYLWNYLVKCHWKTKIRLHFLEFLHEIFIVAREDQSSSVHNNLNVHGGEADTRLALCVLEADESCCRLPSSSHLCKYVVPRTQGPWYWPTIRFLLQFILPSASPAKHIAILLHPIPSLTRQSSPFHTL